MDRPRDEENAAHPLIFNNLSEAISQPRLRWEKFRDRIEICRLYQVPGGASAAFLRYAPGARLERHEHLGYEHIYVIRGSQTDDNGTHRAGALIIHPPGTTHEVCSPEGCVVLAIWERAVTMLDTRPKPSP